MTTRLDRAVMAGLAVILASGAALTLDIPNTAPQGTVAACEVEDGSAGPLPCFWDAQRQGNGSGESYVITDRP